MLVQVCQGKLIQDTCCFKCFQRTLQMKWFFSVDSFCNNLITIIYCYTGTVYKSIEKHGVIVISTAKMPQRYTIYFTDKLWATWLGHPMNQTFAMCWLNFKIHDGLSQTPQFKPHFVFLNYKYFASINVEIFYGNEVLEYLTLLLSCIFAAMHYLNFR